MTTAVQASTDSMVWLKPTDQAMVALALQLAEKIDDAARGEPREIGYLSQCLTAVLRSLGGSPQERKALNIEGEANGKLSELRAARAARQRGAKDLDSAPS